MRYVPKLIPEQHRVLTDYFKGGVYNRGQEKKSVTILYWFLSVNFLLAALLFIGHPLLLLLLGVAGFILLPPSAKWLEQRFRFSLTPKVKAILVTPLFISSIPLANYYLELDAKEALVLSARKEADDKQRLLAERQEAQRKDSVAHYLQAAASFQKQGKPDQALKMLSLASMFSPNEAELASANQIRSDLSLQRTLQLVKKGEFKSAIPELTNLLSSAPGNIDLLYNRALCLSKVGKTKEAVDDLKLAMEHGSSEAEKLHNKINPIRKKIIGYTTLCCDGSTSSARGRGACSWHGGVCNWNEPVYEEYRKY